MNHSSWSLILVIITEILERVLVIFHKSSRCDYDRRTIFNIKLYITWTCSKKVQVGKDQEKAQSEKDSHSKNRGGKKPN